LNTTIIEKNVEAGNALNGEGNANGDDPSNNAISFVKLVLLFLFNFIYQAPVVGRSSGNNGRSRERNNRSSLQNSPQLRDLMTVVREYFKPLEY